MGQIWGVARMAHIVPLLANHYQRVGKNEILFIEAVGARCIVPLQTHRDWRRSYFFRAASRKKPIFAM